MIDHSPTFYVYTLAHPMSMGGTVFYVGKGRGMRILQHENEARSGVQSAKCAIIRAIWQAGGQVVKQKVTERISHKEALRLEDELINQYGLFELANQLPGRKIASCEFRKTQIGYDAKTHRALLIRGLPADVVCALQDRAQEAGLKCEDWLFQQIVKLSQKGDSYA